MAVATGPPLAAPPARELLFASGASKCRGCLRCPPPPIPSGSRRHSMWPREQRCGQRRVTVAAERKKSGLSFGDQLLDYIEGGPKLRKWYGAPGREDDVPEEDITELVEEEPVKRKEEEESVRNMVLVTDADSDTGQLVVLELILRRLPVRALVKDLKAATVGFGAYAEPVAGDVNNKEVLRRVLRGVRAVICPTKVGELASRELVQGVEHIVLLSKLAVNRSQSGIGALFGGLSTRDAEKNEAAISSVGIPYTIVRAGSLKDEQGGLLGFRYGQVRIIDPSLLVGRQSFFRSSHHPRKLGHLVYRVRSGQCDFRYENQDENVQGTISREDAAYICVEALQSPPQSALVFEIVNGKEEVEDWSVVFTAMKEKNAESQ